MNQIITNPFAYMQKIMLCGICCLFLASCGKGIKCPGFPKHLVDYFPYHENEVISFVNQHSDTLSYRIGKPNASQKYALRKNDDCCDEPLFSILALRQRSPLEVLGFNTPQLWVSMSVANDCVPITSIGVSINNFYWDDDYINGGTSALSLVDRKGKDPFDPKNSAIFGETVVLENSKQQISRVVIVKGKGITEFYDQKYDFQWESTNNKK